MDLPTYADVLAAAPIVHRYLQPTLLYDWPLLARRLGFSLFLKHENHQPTGAFKVRGGVNLVSRLSGEARERGIIGCSTGNHGQSLAFAARQFGVRCVIVVPTGSNPGKCQSIRALGAELIQHGSDFDEAKARCEELAAEKGYRYVHSANEPLLIAGVGTMGLEMIARLPHPDVLLVPVGLGSGICGSGLVMAARSPQTKIIGVQAAGAPAVHDSWEQGTPVHYDALDTFAEGVATRAAAEMTLDLMRKLLHDFVLVRDEEMKNAMRWLLEDTHNLVEPAGAASVAAAWKLRETLAGKTVAAIVSGGNCDLRVLAQVLQNGD